MRLIDAYALLERFNEKCDMATAIIDEETSKRFHKFCVIADALEDCPTVDAEPVRHGHWIEQTPEDRYSWAPWRCSECKLPSGKHQTNYCPNCGAKMDKNLENGKTI